MPIRPENLDRYPPDWAEISLAIKTRARWRCECLGECGRPASHLDADARCRNHHNRPAYLTGSRVVLTTAHLDHVPEHCDPDNLRAMCQGCHLAYDAEHHARTRQRTRTARLEAQMEPLFALPTPGEQHQHLG